MRTTVEIPDSLYGKLKAKAALDGTSVKEIIIRLVRQELAPADKSRRVEFPLIKAKETRKLRITNEEINELLFG